MIALFTSTGHCAAGAGFADVRGAGCGDTEPDLERANMRPVLQSRFPDPERCSEADLASERDRRRLD